MTRRPDATQMPLLVAFGLSLAPAIALGLARFAYALLLPAMRTSLGWSYALAGGINAANAGGYLVGAAFAAPLAARFGEHRAFTGGVALTAAALLASGATDRYVLLLALRVIAGVGGAVSFVVGAGLATRVGAGGARDRTGLTVAIYFGGAGLGVLASSLVIPPLLDVNMEQSWRLGWLVLGLMAVLAAVGSVAAAARVAAVQRARIGDTGRWPVMALAPTLTAYGLFGAGYISYMTFIVAFLRGEGIESGNISMFWAVLGTAAMLSAFGWGPLLARLPGGWGPSLVFAVVAVGAAIPLASTAMHMEFASAFVFGGAFMAGPTSVTAVARRKLPPAAWTSAIGMLTTLFAIGQGVGPILSGVLSDGPTGVRAGLGVSVAILLASALVALAQRQAPAPARTATRTAVPPRPEHTGPTLTDAAVVGWRPSALANGVDVKRLVTANGRVMELVRCGPGAAFPSHCHTGAEFVYVLEGDLIQNGQRLAEGWASASKAGSAGDIVRSPGGCVFLIVHGQDGEA